MSNLINKFIKGKKIYCNRIDLQRKYKTSRNEKTNTNKK